MGTSGSGKSSVVLAGLVPYLKRQAKEILKEIKIAISNRSLLLYLHNKAPV